MTKTLHNIPKLNTYLGQKKPNKFYATILHNYLTYETKNTHKGDKQV